MNRGFTVVELLITLVVMAILLSLGVAGMRGTQANARDAERKSDVESIARGLEQYYDRGNPNIIGAETRGSYPGTEEFTHILGENRCHGSGLNPYYVSGKCLIAGGYVSQVLPGVSVATVTPPKTTARLWTNWSLTDAQVVTETQNGNYMYRPFNASDNNACNQRCPRFKVYWYSEVESIVKEIKSRHQ